MRELFNVENSSIPVEFVGPDAPEQISSLAMDGDAVWAASGPYVLKYHRGKEVNVILRVGSVFETRAI